METENESKNQYLDSFLEELNERIDTSITQESISCLGPSKMAGFAFTSLAG